MAGAPTPRKAWIIVVCLAALFGVASAVGAAGCLVQGRWFEGVLGAGFARASYWIVWGAWLRTPWADREDVDPLLKPRPITDRRLRRYLVLACLAGVAVSLALGIQAIDGRWLE